MRIVLYNLDPFVKTFKFRCRTCGCMVQKNGIRCHECASKESWGSGTRKPRRKIYPTDTTMIFVFGSNLAGRHGKGAAKAAIDHHGAIYGKAEGPQGESYAIPTKDKNLRPLPLNDIAIHIGRFLEYSQEHPHLNFLVTRIGCGLAGYTDAEVKVYFENAPSNCILPFGWRKSNENPERPPSLVHQG